jgi:hypothetical protein
MFIPWNSADNGWSCGIKHLIEGNNLISPVGVEILREVG